MLYGLADAAGALYALGVTGAGAGAAAAAAGAGAGAGVLPNATFLFSIEGRFVPTERPTVAALTPVRAGVVTVALGANVVLEADALEGLRVGVREG